MYKLNFKGKAFKQFEKLDSKVRERIIKAIDEKLIVDPDLYLVRLSSVPLYKFRVGDYRIICEKNDQELVILIVKMGHRNNVYNNINKLLLNRE